MSEIERRLVTATIAVDIERDESGLWFVTSPMIKGLLAVAHSLDEARLGAPVAIDNLSLANLEPETIALQRAAKDKCPAPAPQPYPT
jgi:predicted RNase H-like HicB family nuclease